MDDAGNGIDLKSLAAGFYAILRIEKSPIKIAKAIRQFHGNYIPENHILGMRSGRSTSFITRYNGVLRSDH